MGEQAKKPHISAGLLAHVDAGKTTLSEQLLSITGAIRNPGSVDAGTAHTDTMSVERRRGISVKAACVRMEYEGLCLDLIDTPGHADFAAEVERSLWAMDGAVLVVCAVEGVQPQTELLFRAVEEQGLPVIFFINKTDRAGADPERVLREIQSLLSPKALMAEDAEAVAERLCDTDDDFMERYLNGETFPPELLRSRLGQLCRDRQAYPVLAGSALRGEGVEAVLEAIRDFLPQARKTEDLCGIAFAACQDRALGRGIWVRLYGGCLENRDPVRLPTGIDPLTGEEKTVTVKISQIQTPDGRPVGRLEAGEIGIVFGLGNVPIGHVLGDSKAIPRTVAPGRLRTPLISVRAIPDKPEQLQSLRRACDVLADEDPLLQVSYISYLGVLQLQAMGTIQLEVLQEVLQSRFGIGVSFSEPAILYQETVTRACEGFVAYTMPKPCWAILKFRIEPGERGSGVHFASQVPVRELAMRYQNQVAQAIPLALSQGRMGWPVTDVKITLVEGNSHQYHTHPLDFIVATPMGIQDGLRNGGSTLLEPILEVRFLLPPDSVGRVISDVALMRGEVLSSKVEGSRVILNALLPVSTSLDYAVTLAGITGGAGGMSVRLHSYRECPQDVTATAPRRGVDPLDTSKYILAARSALEGGIFDI